MQRVARLAVLGLVGCGSSVPVTNGGEADAAIDLGSPFFDDAGQGEASTWPETDSGFVIDASVVPADRFVTKVVSYTPGSCAGFGQSAMPSIVVGPPIGGGTTQGSTDVVSLGGGGEIVVSFEPNAIVDGPGVDLIVFENPFWIGGNPNHIYDEPGEVSVSDDGVSWVPFPCTTPQSAPPPYGQCGGWHVIDSNPDNGINPLDPSVAGGDPYDLADIGVKHARYVRVRDMTQETCPTAGPKPITNGFDLDAMGIVNAEMP
jgi:hypothetical protein